MEFEKRKLLSHGEANHGKRCKTAEAKATGGVKTVGVPPPPGDDEVEEFFAILKRIHVALNYFQKRNAGGGRELTESATASGELLFQPEDFDGGTEKAPEKPDRSRCAGLDLNAHPPTDVADFA